MKKVSFDIHKWGVRALVALGTAIGLSSCSHKVVGPNPAEGVYGPPPGYNPPTINVIEDVYGPPVERIDSIRANDKPELKQDKDIE